MKSPTLAGVRLVLAACVATSGCSPDAVVAPEARQPEVRQPGIRQPAPSLNLVSTAAGECGDYSTSVGDVDRVWPCGTEIQVLTTGGGDVGALQHATGEWNSAFPASTGMPRFTSQARTKQVRATCDPTSPTCASAASVKGEVIGTPGTSTTLSIDLAIGSGSGSGSAEAVSLHELGHVMGMGDTWDASGAYRVTNVSDHCTSSVTLPGNTYTNTELCQHLVELFRYAYGGRSTSPSWGKHLVTGIAGVPSSITLTMGTNGTVGTPLLMLTRVHPSLCGATACEDVTPPASSLTWHSTLTTRVTVTASGNGATLVPQSPGTANVYPTMSSSTFEFASPMSQIAVTVRPKAPLSPSAGSITSSSATISWTNGDALATTTVRYKHSGESTWHSTSVAAGVTSAPLSGLTGASLYAVELTHVRNGVSSAVTPLSFSTLAPPLGVTAFFPSACDESLYGGKTYNNWTLKWIGNAVGLTNFAVRQASTSDTTSGSIVKTGKTTGTGTTTLAPVLASGTPANRYFWVRFSNSSTTTSWFPLSDFPLNVAGACAV